MSDKLNHSCRGVCSGWQDGYNIGTQAMAKISEGWRKKHQANKKKLELAERMAEFLKNKSLFFSRDYIIEDANELVDAWYGPIEKEKK